MILSPQILLAISSQFGSFKIDRVNGGSNDEFLRFGYWSRVDVNRLQQIIGDEATVIENSLDCDDCGNLFSYIIK
jgi:hypothetical protein